MTTITRERACEGLLPGWNLACQHCGSFGATHSASPGTTGRSNRLCPDCQGRVLDAYLVFRDLEKVRFFESGGVNRRVWPKVALEQYDAEQQRLAEGRTQRETDD